MIKENGFDIIISSDSQYNELCAEIYYDREFVAIITQEQGIDRAIIEIEPRENTSKWIFSYSEFIDVLRDGHDTLMKMKK